MKKNSPRRLTTARSSDKVLKQINRELDYLKVRKEHREILVDAIKNRAALRFQMDQRIDGVDYSIVVSKMSDAQGRVQDNLAALHLWLRGRAISMERKIETLEEAFGAHVNLKMSNLPPGFGKHLLASTCNLALMGPEEK